MTNTATDTWQQNWDNAIEGCASLINAISFKKFKHMESLSEETECFTADVVMNGKIVARASNLGHGADTLIVYADPTSMLAVTCAVTNALTAAGVAGNFLRFDALVDEAVNNELNRRHVAKQQKAFAKKCHSKGLHMICLADDTMVGIKVYPDSITEWKGVAITARFPLPTK